MRGTMPKAPKIMLVAEQPGHHQMPLAKSLRSICGDAFRVAFLFPITEERKSMGWEDVAADCPWVIRIWESSEAMDEFMHWIDESDAVLFPSYWAYPPVPDMIKWRLEKRKLCLPYSERRWKKPAKLSSLHYHMIRPLLQAWSVNTHDCHYLAIGTHAAWDQARMKMFKNRMWTFGYFVPVLDQPPLPKPDGTMQILWAGRMLDWKSIDLILQAVQLVKGRGLDFTLTLIGDGPDRKRIENLADELNLKTGVKYLPPTSPDEIRQAMKRSHIYVLPSNYMEGWGVVLNEAMGEGCAVVASEAAGASKMLIKDGETGFLFPVGDFRVLADKLEYLLSHRKEAEEMGVRAWKCLKELWGPELAATRLVTLINGLLGFDVMPDYAVGPCSKAVIAEDKRL